MRVKTCPILPASIAVGKFTAATYQKYVGRNVINYEKEMPKALISNKIYLEKPTDEQLQHIIKELTYAIAVQSFERARSGKLNPTRKIEYLRNYRLMPKGIIAIPVGRTDLIPDGYEILERRTIHEVPFPDPKFELRPSQQLIYSQVVDNCFVNAKVGWGKTFTALHLSHKLGQKTLVVTHTTNLRDQWIEEAEALFGHKVGIIGSGKFDIEDHFIVVGNIQSLVKYGDKLAKEFGTVILDEAHHCPATTFTEFIDKLYARYRIGLSGTMQRKDGKHVLLTDFFSSTVYTPPVDNTVEPVVNILRPGVHLTPGAAWAKKINDLLYDEEYQQFIAKLATAQIDKGHSVLIIASRIEFLQKVQEYLGETCVLVTGDTGTEERKQVAKDIDSGEKRAIAGSRQIFAEGISINRLSAVILAEPMKFEGTIEQIIGRIMRKHDQKIDPEVFDINFSDHASRSQNESRLAFYMEKGWEIKRY